MPWFGIESQRNVSRFGC